MLRPTNQMIGWQRNNFPQDNKPKQLYKNNLNPLTSISQPRIKPPIKNRLNLLTYRKLLPKNNKTQTKSLSKAIPYLRLNKNNKETTITHLDSMYRLLLATGMPSSTQTNTHNKIKSSALSFTQISGLLLWKWTMMSPQSNISRTLWNWYFYFLIQNDKYTKARSNLAQCF